MMAFHRSDAQFRCIVGAVGSGKTTAALWEACFFLPRHMAITYNIRHTRWSVVRKTYERLMDTDWYEIDHWFRGNVWHAQRRLMEIHFPASKGCPYPHMVELYFRSLDQPDSMDKLRSLNLTGYWIDEAHEVHETAKQMLVTRLGRWPQTYTDHNGVDHMGSPVRYGIETSNPMAIDHPMYHKYKWVGCKVDPKTGDLELKRPPGPVPKGKPAKSYIGWWQDAGENEKNLRPGYYEDLKNDFPESPEMLAVLIGGKPGYKPEGKGVYRNFDIGRHMAQLPLEWVKVSDQYTGMETGAPLSAGWDNNGLSCACVVGQRTGPFSFQALREYYDDRMNIVDLCKWVLSDLQMFYPGSTCVHYCDPAGFAKQSDPRGGFTSNAQMATDLTGIVFVPSRQELDLRINAVDQMLARSGGLLIDPSCTRLINGFQGGYVLEENPRMGINEFKEAPKKNKFSHVHDALQYVIVSLFYPTMKAEIKETAREKAMLHNPLYEGLQSRRYEEGGGVTVDMDSRFGR
jgi:hypothetical protein